MSTGLVHSDRFLEHDTGRGHPERPDRLRAIVERLKVSGLWDQFEHLAFEPADAAAIEAVHDRVYLERLRSACAQGQPYIDAPDSAISAVSDAVARLAAGGAVAAVDAVMHGVCDNALCLMRPPGHHAERDRSMGFCLLNNIAIAADYLTREHDLQRVAVVDFDVHHGNGTQHLFEQRADVLFISVHQDPHALYPGTGFAHETGQGAGQGYTLNVPLPAGSGDAAYRQAFEQQVLPALAAYHPEFLLISAGFDAAAADPLAQMAVTAEGFAWIAQQLVAAASQHAGGKVVALLEGGYDLASLAAGVEQLAVVLLAPEECASD